MVNALMSLSPRHDNSVRGGALQGAQREGGAQREDTVWRGIVSAETITAQPGGAKEESFIAFSDQRRRSMMGGKLHGVGRQEEGS